MFPTFEIFGRTVGTYALCSIAGLLVCGFVACRLGKQRDVCSEDVLLLIVAVGLGVLVGGHLLYGITNLPLIVHVLKAGKPLALTLRALVVCFSGSVFYGGLFGSILAARLMTRPDKRPDGTARYDLFAVCVPLFHTFGRIGCFLGGCCYGRESSVGFIVAHNDLVPELCGVRRFPVALVEAVGNFLIFLFLWRLWKKRSYPGRLIRIYLLCYAPVRFILEFWRGDAVRGIWFGLSTSQWISLIAFGVTLLLWFLPRQRRPAAPPRDGT